MGTGINKEFGRVGESLARGYLRQLGIEIIHAPFSCRCGEIDIIAREGRTLAFIEVKARRNSTCGAPVEAVSWAKQQRIARVAQVFLAFYNRVQFDYCRFDVLGISTDKVTGRSEIQYIRDAFRLDGRTHAFSC